MIASASAADELSLVGLACFQAGPRRRERDGAEEECQPLEQDRLLFAISGATASMAIVTILKRRLSGDEDARSRTKAMESSTALECATR